VTTEAMGCHLRFLLISAYKQTPIISSESTTVQVGLVCYKNRSEGTVVVLLE